MPEKYDITKPLPVTMATGEAGQANPETQKNGWYSVPWRLVSVGSFWVSNGFLIEYTEDVSSREKVILLCFCLK